MGRGRDPEPHRAVDIQEPAPGAPEDLQALEMLAGPLTGIYDPTGTGRVLFAFFSAMAETERESIREATLEGLNAAARNGSHGSIHRALAEHERRQAFPEAVARAHSDFAARPAPDRPDCLDHA